MSLKVIQITDCHLAADPTSPYRGQNAGENLERVWAEARRWAPDIVMLTGDLSEDASKESYARLQRIVDTQVPVLALPGNHDDPELMKAFFALGPWDGPFGFERDNWLLVMLDSSRPGRIDGEFTGLHLEQLGSVLASSSMPNVLVALHHQPVAVDAPWIDRYSLASPQAFLDVIDSDARVRCVVWGHIHHHFKAQRNGVLFLGGPSSAANSLAGSRRFQLDPAGPACRSLRLAESGEVEYGQLGVDMN